MDLLGDLGTADQLTAARSENAVLQAKVKELAAQVKVLTYEKASLQAEVQLYRQEAALPNFSKLALGAGGGAGESKQMDLDSPNNSSAATRAFFKSGNGVYCRHPDLVLHELHQAANPLTVALSPDETVLISGGADRSVHLVQWGAVDANHRSSTSIDTKYACRVTDFPAPVICVAAASCTGGVNLIAVGGMDGGLTILSYRVHPTTRALEAKRLPQQQQPQHKKYIKCVEWSFHGSTLATASADGSIHLYRVQQQQQSTAQMMDDDDDDDGASRIQITYWQSLHLSGPVECLAFTSDTTLVAHARGTPVLTEFNLADDDCAVTEINLNTNHASATRGGFDDHVSFCCLDLKVSPCRQFLAVATDHDRHIILDWQHHQKQQVRNLYGHAADAYSSPVLAWSCNGQYLYCNDQRTSALTVYDIASSQIVHSLPHPHTRPIKALWSSKHTNTLVTTSFDRETVVWFAPAE